MGTSQFTIYLLDTELLAQEIIDEFNEDKDDDEQYIIKKILNLNI